MTTITEDILNWSIKHVEIPRAGLPICPYAKQARLQNQVTIEEVESELFLERLCELAGGFNQTDQKLVILACADISMGPDTLFDYVHALNHVYVPLNTYLMASYPEEEAETFLGDWEPVNEFLMVLIQPFEELESASAALHKIGYYNNWSQEYYADTVTLRQSYRRIYHARNEEKIKEKEHEEKHEKEIHEKR